MTDFDWEDYHTLACELASDEDSAKKRTSINRSYYSAFCLARDYLIKHKAYLDKSNKKIINSEKSEAHYEVRRTFKELYSKHKRGDPKIGKKISKKLDRMRLKRNKVDYEKSFSNLKSEADTCIKNSEFVLQNLENFL